MCRTPKELKAYTQQVFANVPKPEQATTQEDEAQAREAFSHIKHVLYIIRENRTYDQVFGDLGRGNGDPKLVLFGKDVTPNAHALANRTVILDNLYFNGEVSEDGHQWSNAAYATNFTEKAWPYSYSSRGEPEADERLTSSPAGYLWDNCRKHGLSYISYGSSPQFVADPGTAPRYCGKVGLGGPLQQRLAERHDEGLGMRARYGKGAVLHRRPASRRTDRRVVAIHGHAPARGPHPWTGGGRLYAQSHGGIKRCWRLGRVVEAISHSRFWAETAIFVIEDDAQNGPDHVDAHRTVGLVISPYTKQGSWTARTTPRLRWSAPSS